AASGQPAARGPRRGDDGLPLLLQPDRLDLGGPAHRPGGARGRFDRGILRLGAAVARRDGGGGADRGRRPAPWRGPPRPRRARRRAAVLYALGAGTAASLLGFALTGDLFRLMTVPREVAALGYRYLDTWLLGGPLVFGFFAIEATFR